MSLKKLSFAIASVILVGTGCSSSGGKSSSSAVSSASSSAAADATIEAVGLDKARQVLETNARIAYAAYSDAVDTAIALQDALDTFQQDPTQENLDAAKMAWLVAREPYGQTEVYRFRLSPIDSTNYSDENGPEGDINAWPLGEALIDYVVEGTDFGADQVGVTSHATGVDYPNENIIQSDIEINEALISNTATADDEHDVISGYHAIEFLLWGQDLNADGDANTENTREESTSGNILNSGGHRPLTDFTTDQYAARRHQYLEVVVNKLVADLQSVQQAWAVDGEYRQAFTTAANVAEAEQRIAEILIGMGTLSEGELAGERIQIAFESNSQEDEHSCFSDNTHRDIWLNAEGVSNSYYGVYGGYDSDLDGVDDAGVLITDGYGIYDYLMDAGESSLTASLDTAFDNTKAAYQRVDQSARGGVPVDNLIMPAYQVEGSPLYDMIITLNAQSALIAQIAEEMGLDAVVVDPDASACDTENPLSSCDE